MNGVSTDTRCGHASVQRSFRLRSVLVAVVAGLLCLTRPAFHSDLQAKPVRFAGQSPDDSEELGLSTDASQPLLDVVVEGNTTIPAEDIAKKIKSRAGRPADDKLIREDVRSLYATRWFFSVEPRYRQTPDGPILVFRVFERPMLQRVEFKGNDKIKTKHLEALTGLKVGGAFDVGVNREAAARIESHYQEKGYVFATVKLEKGEAKDDREVVFLITEGPKVHVSDVSFTGNKFFSEATLKTKLRTKRQILWLFGGKYDPATIPDDIAAIKEYYHGLGFFDVQIKHKLHFSEDREKVEFEYQIEEGLRYKVRQVEFAGNEVIPTNSLQSNMKVLPNEFFNARYLTSDIEKVTNQYGELGRIFARIDAVPRFLEEPGTVDIVYNIDEDKPYRVRRIDVQIAGEHPHTREAEVINRMRIKPGDLANPTLIKKSERQIKNSQIFAGATPGAGEPPQIKVSKGDEERRAASRLQVVRGQGVQEDPTSPYGVSPQGDPLGRALREPPEGWVDLNVNVAEAQTGRLMFGVGVNSDAGVVGSAMLEENNFDISRPPTSFQDFLDGTAFRGGGQQFKLEAVPGERVSRYMMSWRDPYFLDQDLSFGVSGFFFNRIYPDWDEQRVGGRFTFGKQFTPEISSSVALRLEEVTLDNPTVPTPGELQRALGSTFLSTIRASIAHDTRDSPFLAGEGHFVEASFEQGVGDFVYPRIELDARQYFTLKSRPDGTGRQILSVGGQLGWTGNDTPIYEKFYAGGFQSFRGFAFRGVSPRDLGVTVGGQWLALGTVEYLFPVTANDMLQVVTFTDFGTVEEDVALDRFRLSVGAGLRVTIPAMGPVPIALDWAVPVMKESFDDERLFSFYVGFFR